MKTVKIIAIPPGQAPEWVRKEWVGLVMPLANTEPGFGIGILGGQPENTGGFRVDGQVAIELLAEKSPKAADWWRINAPHVLLGFLVFRKDVCEV